MRRNRLLYLLLTIIVMILGLLSRKINDLPKIIELYSGDILWALMVFLIIAFIFNKKSTIFIISWAIIDIMINKINIKVISNVER